MKKYFWFLVVFALSSCSVTKSTYIEYKALSNAQARRVKNNLEVEKTRDYYALTLQKMKQSPVMADSILGYKGRICNLSRYRRIQFNIVSQIDGRVVLSDFLLPGQQSERYLLPGKYYCRIYINGKLIDQASFKVDSDIHYVFNNPVHWYVCRD